MSKIAECLEVIAYQLELGPDCFPDIRLERCRQPEGPDRWAIRRSAFVLNKQRQWEYEPLPSSRTKAFYRRCRFDSIEKAVSCWRKFKQSH